MRKWILFTKTGEWITNPKSCSDSKLTLTTKPTYQYWLDLVDESLNRQCSCRSWLEHLPWQMAAPWWGGKLQSWTKMLKKMHVVCLIFKARFTQDSSPFPQKNKVEVLPEGFCTQLNNIDQGGWGRGHHGTKFTAGGVSCELRRCKILNTFCPRLSLIHFGG